MSGTPRNPAHREISTSYPRPLSRPHPLRDDELMPSPTLPRASSSESTTTTSKRRRQLAPTITLTLTLDDTTGPHSRPSLNPPSPPVRLRTRTRTPTMRLRSCLYANTFRVTLTLLLPSLRPCPRSELPERAEVTRTAQLCAPCHLFLAFAFAECAETTAHIVPPYLSPLPHTLTVSHALIHPLAGPDVLDSQYNHSVYDYEIK